MTSKNIRKCLAVVALITSGSAVGLPEPYKTPLIALGTGLNAASLYLLKEEKEEIGVQGEERREDTSAKAPD